MDFSLTDEQRAVTELAGQIMGDRCGLERLKAVEQSADRYDRELWRELATAGLVGAALPEEFGGSGGGLVAACLLLEQQGRHLPLLPILPTIVAAALPLARFGSAEQQTRFLPGVVSGDVLLSAALTELGAEATAPATTARPDGGGWRLNGVKVAVPMARQAAAVLVPARTTGGRTGVFLVDPQAAGVSLSPQVPGNWEAQFRVELTDVAVGADGVLGGIDRGAEILDWIVARATVGVCAIASGVCGAALRKTAEYASNRKQFDRPIAMFQAVGQRLADSYIDNEAINLTMWQAATRLADEMPSDKEIATAKYWAAEGGSRIAHAALHIHGGISIDTDYPIHRYFLWAKQMEFTMGAGTPQLARLGALIAAAAA